MKINIPTLLFILIMALSFAGPKTRIYLMPIGEVDKAVLEALKDGLGDVFGKEVLNS